MRIFVGQIYVKPGITFPFSLKFQKWLGDALSARVEVSEQFSRAYGPNFGLGLRISAKEDIEQPEIKGPTVFKKAMNVEFTIFLPHKVRNHHETKNALALLQQVLRSVVHVLELLNLDATRVLTESNLLETEFLNTHGLLDAPK